MAKAEVGDDVYGDDPTINALESLAAKVTGKEAAMFVPSGTFGNQVSLFTWCERGTEVILGEECHIIQHEAGAASMIAGVQTRCISAPDGVLDAEAVRRRIRKQELHEPPTSLVCMENAHSCGKAVPLSAMKAVYDVAHGAGLPVHLDGARLFNAAAALGCIAREITAYCDSVSFCISKGLCAPVGSLVCGPAAFIEKARLRRKVMGGGMRQAGILAAAGIIAVEEMANRLSEDHANARLLEDGLEKLPGVTLPSGKLNINMAWFRYGDGSGGADYVKAFARRGIIISPPDSTGLFRFVTHEQVRRADVDTILNACEEVFR
jgi:threonine aldolase